MSFSLVNNLTCNLSVCFSDIRLHLCFFFLLFFFWHLWHQSTRLCPSTVNSSCLHPQFSPPAKSSQPIIMDSIWEEETWQQHFSPRHLQQKHLQSATAVWEERPTWQASVTGFISAHSGPGCLCRHAWPLFRLTHGWQTKLRGLHAACRDDSLVFRARKCDRKLIPYGRPCGSETKFRCCCLEIGEVILDKENLYQQVQTVVSLWFISLYPLITDIHYALYIFL